MVRVRVVCECNNMLCVNTSMYIYVAMSAHIAIIRPFFHCGKEVLFNLGSAIDCAL